MGKFSLIRYLGEAFNALSSPKMIGSMLTTITTITISLSAQASSNEAYSANTPSLFTKERPWCENLKISDVADVPVKDTDELPYNLRGAYICVKQKDGCMRCMPAEDFKVVKRNRTGSGSIGYAGSSASNSSINLKDKSAASSASTALPDKTGKLNRISFLTGVGPSARINIKSSTNNGASNYVFTPTTAAPVAGISYQRKITTSLSLGAQAQTNGSYLLDIGFDY